MQQVAGAPGGLAGAQHKQKLRVVVTGELVQLAGAGHFLQHVGEVRGGVDGVGKALCLHHEFRELDLVERAHAVGQLHPGLEAAVALAGCRGLPLLGGVVQPFNGKRLAAGAARGWQGGQGRVARDKAFGLDGRDHIDQRVQPWAAFQAVRGHRHAQGIARIHRVFVRLCTLVQVRIAGGVARAQVGVERRFLAQGGFKQGVACDGGRAVRVRGQGFFGSVAVQDPGVVGHDGRQHQPTGDCQTQ